MLKSSFPDLPWPDIAALGFDVDGTLYDEQQFIAQVYADIAPLIAARTGTAGAEQLYDWMLARWCEKGSSYPRIFDEACALADAAIGPASRNAIVQECLDVFRSFRPQLELDPYVAGLLDEAAAGFRCFIVTDGQPRLQSAKIDALGLHRWFAPGDIAITGAYGADCCKPAAGVIQHLPLADLSPDAVVYFGDRDVDRQFSRNCGFRFCSVKVMRD